MLGLDEGCDWIRLLNYSFDYVVEEQLGVCKEAGVEMELSGWILEDKYGKIAT